jgi:hypothetical protein
MKIKVQLVRLGGGYLKAIIGQSRDLETGGWSVDSVFGQDEEELLNRLNTRLPGIRQALRREKHELTK